MLEKVEDTERGAPARLYLSTDVIDLGEAVSGTAVRQELHLRNLGGSPLRISGTEASCGCTVVSLDQTVIAPGGMAAMEILVDTTGKMGPVEKTITIHSNDPVQPERLLTLRLRVKSVAHGNVDVKSTSIFQGDCRRCHVDRGIGLSGQGLFNADCSMCHRGKDDDYSPGAPVEVLRILDAAALEEAIRHGVPGSSMPGYSKAEGGPLTDAEIQSLVNYLLETR